MFQPIIMLDEGYVRYYMRDYVWIVVPQNAHLFSRNLVESPKCICGITEAVSHFLLDCPRHTTLRQQLFFSLLDIPETISLNLLIFGLVNLND